MTCPQPFSYFGGKSNLAQRIVALLPPHETYIEPFAGSLAVLFAKPPSRFEVVNDVDQAIVTFFRVLRDRRVELEEAVWLSPHARDEFYAADPYEPGLDEVEVARRFFVRVLQSFSKTSNRANGWSLATRSTQSISERMDRKLGLFGTIAHRLRSVAIENCDAITLVERLADENAVVYVDAPYVHSTRISPVQRKRAGDYVHEMDDVAHRRLASVLHATRAAVVLSGYPSALYDELYGDWSRREFTVNCNSGNANKGAKRSPRIECLWSNRPFRTELFDREVH